MPLYQATELCKTFRPGSKNEVRAVAEVSFSVEAGSFLALVGPSGSGKSTLLSMLGALDRPTSGRLSFDGSQLTEASDVGLARIRRRMGFVFQDSAMLPGLSAIDNIGYALIPRGGPRAKRREIADRWLEKLELSGIATSRADELSGGERQRLAVARALAGDPEILLADEPTSNLDRQTAELVLAQLVQFQRSERTLIIATHDSELLRLATDVLRLRDGRLEPDGS